MKPIYKIIFCLVTLAFFGSGCDEIPPNIGSCQTERVVLVEEFTGVRCVNCPTGARRIKQLIEQYSAEKLLAISIHSGYFAPPYPNMEDFRLPIGEQIDATLGPITAYPIAMVNRKKFDTESERAIGLNKWAGYIEREFCLAPQVSLNIQNNYDASTRQLQTTVQAAGIGNPIFEQAIGMSVYITENKIESMQLDVNGIDSNYIHEHVLRHSFISTVEGININNSHTPFQNNTQSFSFTLPNHWKAEECYVVGIVHYRGNNGRFDVLQAGMRKVN